MLVLLKDKTALHHEKAIAMADAQRVRNSTRTFGQGKKMDGIQEVRFTDSIFAYDAIDVWDKFKLRLLIGFKLFDL
jgi:hypothetical protein